MKCRKPGQPAFKPTNAERELVEQMSSVGIPQESICLVVRDGIDDKTLRKHFRRELDTAATKANAEVAGTLYNKAMSGDTTALIWWTKTRMKWSEKQEIEHGGAIKSEMIIEFVGAKRRPKL
jgi:hypothetical protein